MFNYSSVAFLIRWHKGYNRRKIQNKVIQMGSFTKKSDILEGGMVIRGQLIARTVTDIRNI